MVECVSKHFQMYFFQLTKFVSIVFLLDEVSDLRAR